MVDLNMDALRSRGMTPDDVVNALANQNLQAPSGDAKIGDVDYQVPLNNSTETVAALNDFPVRALGKTTVFLRDIGNVRDGYIVQTNAVDENGRPGALMTIRKTGGVSTLSVINGVRDALPDIEHLLPSGMSIRALFDQSIFVKAALNSVVMSGLMAAALTALMILLFLGNWRLTLIILASIPLSVITAILVMYCLHQTLNTMTLGGFALAVGILVDNGTVVIENMERWLRLGRPLDVSIIDGAGEVATPTMLATLAISIVFVPVFLLEGTAKYLFSPMSLSVIVSLLASLVLSFTLVPVLFRPLMRSSAHLKMHEDHDPRHRHRKTSNPFKLIHRGFDDGFGWFRETYRSAVAWCTTRPVPTVGFFLALIAASCLLFPRLGMNFFPNVDAGQMRLHRARTGGDKNRADGRGFRQS